MQQVEKISKLRSDMWTKSAPIKAQLEVNRAQLKALWLAETPSQRAIIAKHNEIDGLHRQIRDLRIAFKVRVLKVLTPQQRSELQKVIATKGQGHRGWGGGYGRGKRGGWGRGI